MIAKRFVPVGSIEPAIRLPDAVDEDTAPAEAARFTDGDGTYRVLYWRRPSGGWSVFLPHGGTVELPSGIVEEHADGTISTTTPVSIRTVSGRALSVRSGMFDAGEWHET